MIRGLNLDGEGGGRLRGLYLRGRSRALPLRFPEWRLYSYRWTHAPEAQTNQGNAAEAQKGPDVAGRT